MKYITHYPSYWEANERQLDLMAVDIEAMVFYVPTGPDQVLLGRLPIYALFVPEESVEKAIDLIRLVPDENHICLYGCPDCRSNNVVEQTIEQGFGTGPISLPLTLGIVVFSKVLKMRRSGRKYTCKDCGRTYRKKPN